MENQKALSVFGGTGYVGKRFVELSHFQSHLIEREKRAPVSDDVLYFISTTHNYHIFEDVHLDVQTNITVLLDVLKKLTPGKSTFNFVSSWFVYGDCELPASEETPCLPKGFYSITKLAAEQLLISYCETFGINYRIFRLCNVYGGTDLSASKKKNALHFLVDELKHHRKINLYYDGEFYRDYLHLDDICRGIELCLDSAPKDTIYNIGSGEKICFKDLIETCRKNLNSQSAIGSMEPPEFHQLVQVKDFYMNTQKIQNLGFRPKLSLEKGLEELCRLI
jgi:nucleoside-diphosphate-sugar epimerase